MTNFLKQFNNPSHFGLYKVLANNVEQGVDNLRTYSKAVRLLKADSSWQRSVYPLKTICHSRRRAQPLMQKR